MANELEDLEQKATAVDRYPVGTMQWETFLFANRIDRGRSVSTKEVDGWGDRTVRRVHYYVRNQFGVRDPLYINDLPTWLLTDKENELATGPRTAPDVARSLRHYRELGRMGTSTLKAEEPTVLAIGGVPRSDVSAKVTVNFTPADDWWPLAVPFPAPDGWSPKSDRPTAGLIVGLTDVKTDPVCDPADESKMTVIPARGYGVLVHQGQLVIAEMEEIFPSSPDSCGRYTSQVMQGMKVGKVPRQEATQQAASHPGGHREGPHHYGPSRRHQGQRHGRRRAAGLRGAVRGR